MDDFLFIFKPQTDLSSIASRYNEILAKIGLTLASEKDMNGTTVIHLGFEIDSLRMEVHLFRNKHSLALHTITDLLKAKSITYSMLDEALSSSYHIAVKWSPWDVLFFTTSFPRSVAFVLLVHFVRVYLARCKEGYSMMADISLLLVHNLSDPIISNNVATHASGTKGIGGIYNKQLFFDRVPRHRKKHINWREMFAIFHAFVLWHEQWVVGRVRRSSSTNVQSMAHSLTSLQTILLLSALFDIELGAFWVPSEENIIVDATSRHQFDKLASRIK